MRPTILTVDYLEMSVGAICASIDELWGQVWTVPLSFSQKHARLSDDVSWFGV